MRIRSFSSTLNFAITTLNEDKADDNVNLEKNFDEIMEKAAAYIRKIVAENFDGEEISSYSKKQMLNIRGNDISMIFQEPMTHIKIQIYQ